MNEIEYNVHSIIIEGSNTTDECNSTEELIIADGWNDTEERKHILLIPLIYNIYTTWFNQIVLLIKSLFCLYTQHHGLAGLSCTLLNCALFETELNGEFMNTCSSVFASTLTAARLLMFCGTAVLTFA